MTLVMLLAAAAILGGVVAVAMGWGGELIPAAPDAPAPALDIRTPHDVAMLRPPMGLLGFQTRATSDAFWQIAGVLAGREAEIAGLRSQLARLTGGPEPSAPDAEAAPDARPAPGADPDAGADPGAEAHPDAEAHPAVPADPPGP